MKGEKEICLIDECDKRVLKKFKGTTKGLCGDCHTKWVEGEIEHPKLGKYIPENNAAETLEEENIPTTLTLYISDYPDFMDCLEQGAKLRIRTPEHAAIAYIIMGLKADGLIMSEKP